MEVETTIAVRQLPTSPLRVFASDHQPIRLLAELQAITPAELVHRAVALYVEQNRDLLATVASRAQLMVAAGDLDGLAAVLEGAQGSRRAARIARLEALNPVSG